MGTVTQDEKSFTRAQCTPGCHCFLVGIYSVQRAVIRTRGKVPPRDEVGVSLEPVASQAIDGLEVSGFREQGALRTLRKGEFFTFV